MSDSGTLDRAQSRVASFGFPLPDAPKNKDLDWPSNVADLGSQELAEHMTWCTGWANFARYELAKAETNLAAFTAEYKFLMNDRLSKSSGDRKSVTEKKAEIGRMPDLQKIEQRVLQADAETKLLKALLESYEKKYQTISREITRRGADFDEDGRDRFNA